MPPFHLVISTHPDILDLYLWEILDGPDGAFSASGTAATPEGAFAEAQAARIALAQQLTNGID